MKVVIAPDSFKGSLSSMEAATAMAAGVARACPAATIECLPVSDGGDGMLDAVLRVCEGQRITLPVTGPQRQPVMAEYGLLAQGRLAVIEMASASGLALTDPAQRNPGTATTLGVGETMVDALDRGVKDIIIGVGGSATNDGGVGMAQALGYRFLDAAGAVLDRPAGASLGDIAVVDAGARHRGIGKSTIRVACDVLNPLTGEQGCTRVFAPQKGAVPRQVEILERHMKKFAELLERYSGAAVAELPGAGAAGGLGAGLAAFTGATLCRGFSLVAELIGAAPVIAAADLVITGEGRLDRQTLSGKAPHGVAELARRAGVPVAAVGGSLEREAQAALRRQFDALESVVTGSVSLEEALENAPAMLADAAERVCRAVCAGLAAGGVGR